MNVQRSTSNRSVWSLRNEVRSDHGNDKDNETITNDEKSSQFNNNNNNNNDDSDDDKEEQDNETNSAAVMTTTSKLSSLSLKNNNTNPLLSLLNQLQSERNRQRPPPLLVEDQELMFYDVFLLVNLSLSISFWVVHRMQLDYITVAFNEGCLLSSCWLVAGLWNGAFLTSAVDGHYGSADHRGGPFAAGRLAFTTYIGTCNARLIVALIMAFISHHRVGDGMGEELIPLEFGFGLILMCVWRTFHSNIMPRV